MKTLEKPVTALASIIGKQALIRRETYFDHNKATRYATRIVRQELRGLYTIKALRKPSGTDRVAELRKQRVKSKEIKLALDLTDKEYSACVRYIKASASERRECKYGTHASIVDDIVNSAYILWYEANFTNWQSRVDAAHAKLKVCDPISDFAAVKYAHGNYWKSSRKPKQRKDKAIDDGKLLLDGQWVSVHQSIMGKACKGTAKRVYDDLPSKLSPKAKQVATLLSTGASAGDVADMLQVSRPRVSALISDIRQAIDLREKLIEAEATPNVGNDKALRASYWKARELAERLLIVAEVYAGQASEAYRPLSARIRANVEASRMARNAATAIAVKNAKPKAYNEPREFTRAALVSRVTNALALNDLDEKLGRNKLGAPLLSMETINEAIGAECLLSVLASREPKAESLADDEAQAESLATIRAALPRCFGRDFYKPY